MITHLVDSRNNGRPLCWGGEWHQVPVMLHSDPMKVTCEDCLQRHRSKIKW